MLVGDGLAERPGVDADRCHVARPIEREMRKYQLGEAIGFFEMRVARHDEGIDPDFLIFPDPRGDSLGIADQRGARTATHQTNAGPEIGADLELVAAATMQLLHALLADRIHAGEYFLGRSHRL